MALFDLLIWFFVGGIIGGSVGMGISKLFLFIQKSKDQGNLLKIIQGKSPNNYKLDGKMVNIHKFIYKEDGGEIIRIEITDMIKKTSLEAPKDEKTPIERTKKVFFWKRKKEKKQ